MKKKHRDHFGMQTSQTTKRRVKEQIIRETKMLKKKTRSSAATPCENVSKGICWEGEKVTKYESKGPRTTSGEEEDVTQVEE